MRLAILRLLVQRVRNCEYFGFSQLILRYKLLKLKPRGIAVINGKYINHAGYSVIHAVRHREAVADFRNQELSFVLDGISRQDLSNLNFERQDIDRRQVVCKQWKVSSRAEKYNPYNGNFNNDNKNLPSRKNDNSGLRKEGI